MLIEFKSLPMMALRSRPGEVLDEVARDGAAFLVERNGQQKACLVPISYFLPDIQTSRVTAELDKIIDSNEHYRITISDQREIQLVFREFSGETQVDVTVTLAAWLSEQSAGRIRGADRGGVSASLARMGRCASTAPWLRGTRGNTT